jgi:hypothetical protein
VGRNERRLRVFENSVLRGIFGEQVTGEWRKLHNEELNELYSTPTMRWVGYVARMVEGRGV